MAESNNKTYVCTTCGQTFFLPFQGAPVRCRNQKCGYELQQKIHDVVFKFDPHIRKILGVGAEHQFDVDDMKLFCATVFSNDINLYHDRLTFSATLDRLNTAALSDIPYNFNQ